MKVYKNRTISLPNGKPKFRSNKERVEYLLKLFKKNDKVLILIWADPDSLSSAYALKRILAKRVSQVTLSNVNEIKRLNNQVMVKVLRIPLKPFSQIVLDDYTKFVLIDSQPTHREEFKKINFNVVIDHHPETEGWKADFVDIRSDYGATATILYEYLRTLKIKPSVYLSTALVYGIKTDTDNFKKSALIQDVLAFQRLYKRVNVNLLSKIENADLRRSELKYFRIALNQLKFKNKKIYVYIGKVITPDVLVLIADFLNRVYETSWVFVGGEFKKKLVIIIRCDGYKKDAGRLASKLFGEIGNAGGHKEKARAEIPFENLKVSPENFSTLEFIKLFKPYFKEKIN